MNSNNADILQVKKYLAGELDARAMHELERKALSDPFLMDALEGHSKKGINAAHWDDLSARLQQRVQPRQARVIPFRMLAMAASVLVVLTVGGLWLFKSKPVTDQALAINDKTSVAASPLVEKPNILANHDSLLAMNKPVAVIRSPRGSYPSSRETMADNSSLSAVSANGTPLAFKMETGEDHKTPGPTVDRRDSVPLDEMVVMGYAARKKSADTQPVSVTLAGRVAGVVTTPPAANATVISGKVVSAQDGLPLPGVTVSVEGIPNAAQTNAEGIFKLPADSTAANVKLNYIGFNSRTVQVQSGNSPTVIAMEPANASLSEVVITGYGTDKRTDAAAHPKNGWESYQQYLNTNAVLPNGKSGTLRVSFTVGNDGSLSNFQVNDNANGLVQQKAIELIKNGPEWVGDSNGKARKVTVKVKFRKAD